MGLTRMQHVDDADLMVDVPDGKVALYRKGGYRPVDQPSGATEPEPSRSGKTDDWVKFASVVTGTDESEWADVGRNDIIAKLEADGHIDPAETSATPNTED